ncbi:ZKSCAN1 [Cordylochernes scorpioides]|uniref:ZKSCAN1 n=1 Tax=Cordylochernes scorpioides TaxID=51811 RepID=A0ABY6KA62_9ARAC|nr:ZKSCAN1 [Cordylochernes scorpioides]
MVAINSAVIYKAVKQDGGMARKDFIKQLALQLMRDALNMRNQAKNLSRDLQVLIQKHAGTSSLEFTCSEMASDGDSSLSLSNVSDSSTEIYSLESESDSSDSEDIPNANPWLPVYENQPERLIYRFTPATLSGTLPAPDAHPSEYFYLFMTPSLLQSIVDQTNIYASQYISANRSTAKPRSRTQKRQYIPKSHAKFGIKHWVLCEAQSGYTLQFDIYAGKAASTPSSSKGLAFDVVFRLVNNANLLDKGYHIICDNFYTSVDLALDLYARRTYLTGTMRINRRSLLSSIRIKKLQPSEKLSL